MTLEKFMNLVPETQEMQLCYENTFIVHGAAEALGCMLAENIYHKGTVINVEAEGDVLKVWVEECENT